MESILILIVSKIAQAIEILIIVRVLLSWADNNSFNPLVIQLNNITDFFIKPFRSIVPAEKIGIDISPIIAVIVINIIETMLIDIIQRFIG